MLDRRHRFPDTLASYVYLAPAFLVLLVFHILPLFYAVYISLFNWRIRQGPFVGPLNYHTALASPAFWSSLKVTAFYALGVVPATLVLSFLIAYALHRNLAARTLYRAIYFLPYITSIVAAALIWRWIFHAQYGVLNFLFHTVGLPPQQWLLEPRGIVELILGGLGVNVPAWAAGPSLALTSIIIFTVWHNLGFAVVVMLAGLSNIPAELYDAARIDGAGEWRLIRHVTLPCLSPTLYFMVIILTIGAFQSFGNIYVMTDPDHGGPLGTTRNVTMYIYQNFFEFTRLGYASAVAVLFFFLVLGLTIFQMRVLGPRVHYQ